MTLIDITVPLSESTPRWPGSEGFARRRTQDLSRGDAVTNSSITMDVHCGTHIDAPSHFLNGAATMDDLALESLIGPVWVADLCGKTQVTAEALATTVPAGTERLLLRTDNSLRWGDPFDENFAALDVSGAQYLADRGLLLVGNDYLSVQLFGGDPRTHTTLMEAGVVILEGVDLSQVAEGAYQLLCLPLSIRGAEAAPARALLTDVAS